MIAVLLILAFGVTMFGLGAGYERAKQYEEQKRQARFDYEVQNRVKEIPE